MKALRYGSGISAAFAIGQVAARARSRILVERSVASTSSDQPLGKAVSSDMAIEYGSSPDEHAALQTRTRRSRFPAVACSCQVGKIVPARYSQWRGSRKKWVSLV